VGFQPLSGCDLVRAKIGSDSVIKDLSGCARQRSQSCLHEALEIAAERLS
jgi:hypothetical protein